MKRPLFIVVLILLGTMAHRNWQGPIGLTGSRSGAVLGRSKPNGFSTYLTGCVQNRKFHPSPVAMQDKFHQKAESMANDWVPKPTDGDRT